VPFAFILFKKKDTSKNKVSDTRRWTWKGNNQNRKRKRRIRKRILPESDPINYQSNYGAHFINPISALVNPITVNSGAPYIFDDNVHAGRNNPAEIYQ
jgi:hypothetical protein